MATILRKKHSCRSTPSKCNSRRNVIPKGTRDNRKLKIDTKITHTHTHKHTNVIAKTSYTCLYNACTMYTNTQCEWIFWMWCLAHRLELAVKDTLKGKTFDTINDMLLKLYCIYEKAPKMQTKLCQI